MQNLNLYSCLQTGFLDAQYSFVFSIRLKPGRFYSTNNYKPFKTYSNSDLYKLQILADNNDLSGVYL